MLLCSRFICGLKGVSGWTLSIATCRELWMIVDFYRNHTLPETNSTAEKCCLGDDPFLLGYLCSGANCLLVSGSRVFHRKSLIPLFQGSLYYQPKTNVISYKGNFIKNGHTFASSLIPPKWVPFNDTLVGGFKPFRKYYSDWIISPSRDLKNEKYLKPPTSTCWIRPWFFPSKEIRGRRFLFGHPTSWPIALKSWMQYPSLEVDGDHTTGEYECVSRIEGLF